MKKGQTHKMPEKLWNSHKILQVRYGCCLDAVSLIQRSLGAYQHSPAVDPMAYDSFRDFPVSVVVGVLVGKLTQRSELGTGQRGARQLAFEFTFRYPVTQKLLDRQ